MPVASDIGSDQLATPSAGEREIDEILSDSFPASDAPPWTLGVRHDTVIVDDVRLHRRNHGGGP